MTPLARNNFNFPDPRFSPAPESRRNASKSLVLLCSLNFVIAILGYSLTMALLSPLGVDLDISSGENRLFTWSYRIFSFGIGVATLFSVRSRPFPKIDWRVGLLIFFWVIYLIRLFYDLEIRSVTSFSVLAYNVHKPNLSLWAYSMTIFGTLVPLLGISKSIDLIDFRRCANWIFYVGIIALVLSLFSIQKVAEASWTGEITGRTNASAMLNTIAFGHLGLSVAAVAFYQLTSRKNSLWRRLVGIGGILLGAYIVLRAGSRGPILCAFVMAFFYSLSRSRYAAIGIFFAGIFSILIWSFLPQIITLIRAISPVMAGRLEGTIYEGEASGRDSLIQEVWREICDAPLTGLHTDILGYSHNACLDGFMMFGVCFGWIIFVLVLIGFRSAYRILKEQMPNWWVALLAIQSLTAIQTSGTFGSNSFVQVLWIVCVIWTAQRAFDQKNPTFLRNAYRNIPVGFSDR